jgi:hypothetical protein
MNDLASIQKKIIDFRNEHDWAQLDGFQIGNIKIKT